MSEPHRLSAGDKAPDFSLASDRGDEVNLYALLEEGKRVIVYFYPAASTPGCTKQACDFRDNLAELGDAGLDVIDATSSIERRRSSGSSSSYTSRPRVMSPT